MTLSAKNQNRDIRGRFLDQGRGTVIRVHVYGDNIDLADELKDEFVPKAKAAINEASEVLLEEVKRLLSLRQGSAKTAAPEGQPPEQDTGELIRSFKRMPARLSRESEGAPAVVGGIRANNDYGVRLEYGQTDARGIRTLPHPYLRPAMVAVEPRIDALLQERLS
jgi:hypothetical protein